jgi:hypothetical protein
MEEVLNKPGSSATCTPPGNSEACTMGDIDRMKLRMSRTSMSLRMPVPRQPIR